jgi:redox-sensitive bicupin YhaK (pirin superfamily)
MNRKSFIGKSLTSLTLLSFYGSLKGANQLRMDKDFLFMGENHIPYPTTKLMKNIIIHRAETRGGANHGWLNTRHTFSFSQYYNPERVHFGALRVLNDDIIQGGTGFGTHPHNNMEIISIALSGDLEHKDSMGNVQVIRENDIQVMSAGTGVQHSEYNKNKDKEAAFLQIWMFPNKKDAQPRYEQMTFNPQIMNNRLQQILSPDKNDDGLWVNQEAWFYRGKYNLPKNETYSLKKASHGVYVFLIDGAATIGDVKLNNRDGLGVWDIEKLDLMVEPGTDLLLMEVPMNI